MFFSKNNKTEKKYHDDKNKRSLSRRAFQKMHIKKFSEGIVPLYVSVRMVSRHQVLRDIAI
jgi:hypothetical protein